MDAGSLPQSVSSTLSIWILSGPILSHGVSSVCVQVIIIHNYIHPPILEILSLILFRVAFYQVCFFTGHSFTTQIILRKSASSNFSWGRVATVLFLIPFNLQNRQLNNICDLPIGSTTFAKPVHENLHDSQSLGSFQRFKFTALVSSDNFHRLIVTLDSYP